MKNMLLKSFFAILFLVVSTVVYGDVYHKFEIFMFGADVHSEPNKESKVIGRLKEDEKFKSYTKIEDPEGFNSMSHRERMSTWIEIEYKGNIGYVSAQHCMLRKTVRTGDDYKCYINWLKSLSEKNEDGHEDSLTNLIMTLIAGFLYLIAIFLARIKGKGGWISGLCSIVIASSILVYQFMWHGIDVFLGPFLIMIVFSVLFAYIIIKSVNCVFYGMNNSTGLDVEWTFGLFIPALGAFFLVADEHFLWNSNTTILIITAILHLLYCVLIVMELTEKLHSPSLIISLIIVWQIVAFAFFNLSIVFSITFFAIIAFFVALIIVGILFWIIFCGGITYITSTGRVLTESLLFGLRDKFGREYEHVDDNKVTRKE